MNPYDIFFNLCLGLFIGGIILSIISVFLAEMEIQSGGAEIDTEIDSDSEVDIDIDADIDYIEGAEFDVDAVDIGVDMDVGVDIDADMDVELEIDNDVDVDIESDMDMDTDTIGSNTTPAPIMLLISAYLLIFGMTGILLNNIPIDYRFITFISTPIIAFIFIKYLNIVWKKISKSRYYIISSTKNLIGKNADVILLVDNRGSIVGIYSNTPMKFERVHVKPVNENSYFDRGTKVFIVNVKEDFLLVDEIKKEKKRGGNKIEHE